MNNASNISSPGGKTKRKSRKFNFIDLLLILIVIAIAVGIIYVFRPFSWFRGLNSDNTGTIQYAVEVKGVDGEFLNKIRENDTVVDSVTKNTIGTVTAVDYNTKYTKLEYVKREDGQIEGILSEYSDLYNVVITITADYKYAESTGYAVNNCRIAVGEKMYLRFPDYVCEGYCIHINPEKAG